MTQNNINDDVQACSSSAMQTDNKTGVPPLNCWFQYLALSEGVKISLLGSGKSYKKAVAMALSKKYPLSRVG